MPPKKEILPDKVVDIKELDIHSLHPTSVTDLNQGAKYIIIGKPGTGKSSLIEWIMYCKKHIFPVGRAFSGTEDSNGFFSKILPSSFVYNGLDVDNLEPLEQAKLRQLYAKKYLEPAGYNPWFFEVIDDCTYDTKFFKKPIFLNMMKNGRHRRELLLLSLQYCLDIKPEIRTCVDGIFILREAGVSMRKKLYENYGQGIESLDDFNDLMDQLTEDYSALYIDNKATSNKIEDIVFFCKADINKIPKNWQFGCPEFREFHNERYDTNNTIDN